MVDRQRIATERVHMHSIAKLVSWQAQTVAGEISCAVFLPQVSHFTVWGILCSLHS